VLCSTVLCCVQCVLSSVVLSVLISLSCVQYVGSCSERVVLSVLSVLIVLCRVELC